MSPYSKDNLWVCSIHFPQENKELGWTWLRTRTRNFIQFGSDYFVLYWTIVITCSNLLLTKLSASLLDAEVGSKMRETKTTWANATTTTTAFFSLHIICDQVEIRLSEDKWNNGEWSYRRMYSRSDLQFITDLI